MRSKPTFKNEEVELLESMSIRAEKWTFRVPPSYLYEPTESEEGNTSYCRVPQHLESPEVLESCGFKATKAGWLWNRWSAKMADDEQSARDCVYVHDEVRYEGFMAFILEYTYRFGNNRNDCDDEYYQAVEMIPELRSKFVYELGHYAGPPLRQYVFIDYIVNRYEIWKNTELHMRSHIALRHPQKQPASRSKDDSRKSSRKPLSTSKDDSLEPSPTSEQASSEYE